MAELVSRTATRAYEERKMNGGKNIADLIFRTKDNDISASFKLDRYISSPYGISYRNLNNQSIVRHFVPGKTELIPVPVASEKTPIDEELEDAVAVGLEATAGQRSQIMKNTDQIIGDYVEADDMTRAHQALTVLSTGIYPANGAKGSDLGLGYDHGRESSQAITYNFTAGGATFALAIKEIDAALNAQNTPKGNRCIIMGSSWLDKFGTDTGVQAYLQANPVNQLLEQQMGVKYFNGIDGLFVVGRYKAPGTTAPYWILSYEPGTEYVAYSGATAAPFVAPLEALSFSLDDKTFDINRGVNVFDANGKKTRVVGDMVMDSYTDNDPIVTWVRYHKRSMNIYGNINHTCKSTATV